MCVCVCVCEREREREREKRSFREGRRNRERGRGGEKQKREGGTEWGGEGERDCPVAAPRLQTRTPSETPALTWAGCCGSGHRRESPTLALPLEAPNGKGGPCVGTRVGAGQSGSADLHPLLLRPIRASPTHHTTLFRLLKPPPDLSFD